MLYKRLYKYCCIVLCCVVKLCIQIWNLYGRNFPLPADIPAWRQQRAPIPIMIEINIFGIHTKAECLHFDSLCRLELQWIERFSCIQKYLTKLITMMKEKKNGSCFSAKPQLIYNSQQMLFEMNANVTKGLEAILSNISMVVV